ncbi:unnamed protein product, partial [Iphiclides podalirius]
MLDRVHPSREPVAKMPVPIQGRYHWGKNAEAPPTSPTSTPIAKTTNMAVGGPEPGLCDGVEACTVLLNTMQVVPRKKRQGSYKC